MIGPHPRTHSDFGYFSVFAVLQQIAFPLFNIDSFMAFAVPSCIGVRYQVLIS